MSSSGRVKLPKLPPKLAPFPGVDTGHRSVGTLPLPNNQDVLAPVTTDEEIVSATEDGRLSAGPLPRNGRLLLEDESSDLVQVQESVGPPPLIEIRNLRVCHDGREALRIDHLAIEAGTLLGIFGPNGAGKSTLVRAILQVIPTHGEVQFHGRCLSCHSEDLRRFGYVPQTLSFDRTIPVTVEEFLIMAQNPVFLWGMRGTKFDRKVGESLERVGGQHLRKKALGTLSGGEMQRVLLAQSLLRQPEVLILDEPTTGLDLAGDQALLTLLCDLHHEGVTVLLISHDLETLKRVTTHMIGINHCLRYSGPTRYLDESRLLRDVFVGHKHLSHF